MKQSESSPEIILKNRRTVFENSKFHVYADWITDSGGREVPDYLVVAPRIETADLVTGVTVLPIWNEQVVLLRTFRHAVRRESLEAARGFVDAGEDPRQAAVRELVEETGLVTTPDLLIPLGACAPEASTLAARIALFAAPECRMERAQADDEIGLGCLETFSMAQAELLLREMQLEDVTTALCLHRYFMTRR